MTDGEAREMARDLVRGSIIEDAAAQFIAQILKHAHDERIKPLKARAEAAEAQIATLTAQVEWLTGAAKRVLAPLDEPCRHDHHGYCQTHFVEAECSVAALRAALSATKEEGHD